MTGHTPRIAIFSAGLWALRHEIAQLSGMTAVVPGPCEAVAGWGHKPTTRLARRFAGATGKPYIGFEDGFLRSLHPGPAQRPSAMVMDRTGIYYDATGPSDLERSIEAGGSNAATAEARELVALIARLRLSKYNDGEDEVPAALRGAARLVVVIDQTFADQSVAGGLAGPSSFQRMLDMAQAENEGATIAVKLHPEVMSGRKRGYLRDLAAERKLTIIARNVNPHAILDLNPRVYTVSSQFGFEALLRGCDVRCFGMPFYAGWGLTGDDLKVPRRTRLASRDEIAAAAYVRYSRYFDCWTRAPVNAVTAMEQLDFLRRQYFGNGRKLVVHGVARWKRRAITAMAAGPAGPPSFHGDAAAAIAEARRSAGLLAAWGRQATALRDDPRTEGLGIVTIEDGFLRSSGLGAAFAPPRSLVFDGRGIYYDPSRVSDLEQLLAGGQTLDAARGAGLRQSIVAAGLTKYNLHKGHGMPELPAAVEKVLVIGQVDDDAAVDAMRGLAPGATGNINFWLLAEARRRFPLACIIFKPHPDVERMSRAGAIAAREDKKLADIIVPSIAIDRLLPVVDRIVTFGSLAGFEALLRGKKVTVLGLPFYAGWGLTDDALDHPRRHAARGIDELTAAALVHYPRYWDPESNLACPPEVVVARLALGTAPSGAKVLAMTLAGRGVNIWRRLRNAAIRARKKPRPDHPRPT